MRTLIRLFFLLLVTTTPAYADHEPNHRYEVQGYLLDANRNPVPGVGIAISSGNQILGNAVSEDNGFYYMKLHLHDTSIGRKLQISTADFSGTIVMKATAGDKTTRRLHYANFIGGKLQEGQIQGLGESRWIYYLIATLLALIIAVVLSARFKKKRKHQQHTVHSSSGDKHHGRRRRRRKRK